MRFQAIDSVGILACLDQQLDHLAIDDGDLEAHIQTNSPLFCQSLEELYGNVFRQF